MDNIKISLLVDLFQSGRDHTLQIVDGLPVTHRHKQLAPKKATPTWLLGHLARTLDRLVIEWILLEAPVFTEDVGIRFAPEHAGGIAPSATAGDYPGWDQLRSTYVMASDRVIAGLRALSDADLEKPIPGAMPDEYRKRFPTIGSVVRLLSLHDSYHRGQIGMLAKLD